MTVPRRSFLHLTAAAIASAPPGAAWAQTWPARPIRLVVGLVAGGPNDARARLIAEWLTARLGQPVVAC
jgi:tripartite-type tricarboxylate transporter receptor subunit TctC